MPGKLAATLATSSFTLGISPHGKLAEDSGVNRFWTRRLRLVCALSLSSACTGAATFVDSAPSAPPPMSAPSALPPACSAPVVQRSFDHERPSAVRLE